MHCQGLKHSIGRIASETYSTSGGPTITDRFAYRIVMPYDTLGPPVKPLTRTRLARVGKEVRGTPKEASSAAIVAGIRTR